MAHDSQDTRAGSSVTLDALLAEPPLHGRLLTDVMPDTRPVLWSLPLSEVDSRTRAAEAAGSDLLGVAVHAPVAALGDAALTSQLMTDLASRKAAALLVWPGHHGDPVNEEALRRAGDAIGLPVVALGPDADFQRVSQLIATKVLTQSAHVLEYSVKVHRVMGEVFAHGSGLAAMATTMSQLSRSPVFILDLSGETLAHADPRVASPKVPVDVGATIVNQLIAQSRREREANGTASEGGYSRVAELDLESGPTYAVAAPVSVADEPYGVVVVLEPTWPLDEHDLAQHRIIVEQGATLVGSEMLRQRSVQEAQERARDDFVDALLHARFADQHELAARARHYRFDPAARFAVFVVTANGLEPDRRPDGRRAANAARAAGRVAPVDGVLTLTAQIGSMVVVVRQVPSRRSGVAPDPLAERQALQTYGTQLHRAMHQRLGEQVRVAYGGAGTGAQGVARSYREARTAVALGVKVGAAPVCGYDSLKVFAAIEEVATTAAGRSFAEEVLEPLRKADGQTGNLESIVIAYIEESGNLNAAARRLQLHRNTMLYKLDRASRALQMDVRTAETQFMIWLAHRIETLGEVQRALDRELLPPSA
jgi:sugar diacid utilization regulator